MIFVKVTQTMARRLTYLSLFILIALSMSCVKIRHLPPEPVIEFRDFTVFDTITLLGPSKAGRLNFYFEDGDGDLGFDAQGVYLGDTTNLFITCYKKTSGNYVEITDPYDPLKPGNYRIPYIEMTGQNQAMTGTIEVTIYYSLLTSFDDTVRYDFWVKDRAGHISNTASTCDIVFSGDGGCLPGGS